MKKQLSFDVSKSEFELIGKIAARAVKMANGYDFKYSKMDAVMDITACHANGSPLRLDELLKARDGDFGHDIFGIRRHINRETGQLMDCFSPRYSLPPQSEAR